MPKRRLMGCSFPVAIGVIVLLLAMFVVGFLAGPLGKSIVPDVQLPGWLSVSSPHVALPADAVFHVFGFPITNSIIATWITMAVLVGVSYAVSRRMKLIPGRLQMALEFLLGWLYDFCKSAAGDENGRRFFPLVTTIFLFVMFNAWLALVPGYGSIPFIGEVEATGTASSPGIASGHVKIVKDGTEHLEVHDTDVLVLTKGTHELEHAIVHSAAVITEEHDEYTADLCRENEIPCVTGAEHATTHLEAGGIVSVDGSKGTVSKVGHLIRPANTDINTPLAIALISVFMTFVYGFKAFGFKYAGKFFNFGTLIKGTVLLVKGKFGTGITTVITGIVEAFVGLLELLSEFIHIVSFTFRLFGNMTAGEILLLVALFLIPWLFALPFYGLELLIGFLQALIFAGLTLIFLTLAVSHHDEAE
ncbi:F0F1 ATP synthase subunit A [Chloroflexota bacterium]